MGNFSDVLLGNADKVLAACKDLDYQGIAAHDPDEVAKLKAALAELSINAGGSGESLSDYASQQTGPKAGQADSDVASTKAKDRPDDKVEDSASTDDRLTIESKEAVMVLPKTIDELMTNEGFAERIGNVYNSFSGQRTSRFDQVPHRRGLPLFDIVIAPDFAPVAGLHGIFISNKEVMSIILAAEGQATSNWEIMKRKSYANHEEMVELVTLVSAGFDLP